MLMARGLKQVQCQLDINHFMQLPESYRMAEL